MLRKSTQSSAVTWQNIGKTEIFVSHSCSPQSKLVQITAEIGRLYKIPQYFSQYNIKH